MPNSDNARRPKIGIILEAGASVGSGGTGRRFARVFQHFQQHESAAEVWVITNPGFIELMNRASILIDPALNVLEISTDSPSPAATAAGKISSYRDYSARLHALLEREQFDLVHIPLPHLKYSPFLLRKDGHLRQVFSMTTTAGSFKTKNWKARLLYKVGFVSCEAIDTLYSDIAENFPTYSEKFRVSPCSFTDYSRYRPADEKRNIIVFAGRLDAYKNPLLFVDAVAICASHLRGAEWKCFLYGSGELKEQVSARVAELGLGDLIELGAVADLSPHLGRSKIFVSLQQTENYPSQALLEAMAAENAVIATDVGDTRRLVDEEVGLLIAEQTPERLARAIVDLTDAPDSIRALGRKARVRVVGEHNVEVFAEYIQTVWLDVLRQHAQHRRPSAFEVSRVIVGTLLDEFVSRHRRN